ncbi:hypothetical protein N9V96_03270, partial [Polaribacter sp.]|nr:hypothetical protein [Polaribacter sp.]
MIFTLLHVCQIHSFDKEVTTSVASLFTYKKNDSIYLKVKRLYRDKNYTETLKIALNLLKHKDSLSE